MAFLDVDTGRMLFPDGLSLENGLPAQRLNPRFHNPEAGETVLLLAARALKGGSLAPVCWADGEGLCRVDLQVQAVAGRTDAAAGRQRSYLFQAFGLKDPCPDTRRGVKVKYPFGTVTLLTDPYTGRASAQIEYSRPEERAKA